MTKWIKHNPGDPIPKGKVRICDSRGWKSNSYLDAKEWIGWGDDSELEDYRITHYMPEPKPSLLSRFLRWIKKEH